MVKRKGNKSVEMVVVKQEPKWKDADSYIDYTSSLIQYGILMSNKAKNGGKAITDGMDALYGIDGQAIDLTSQQVQYLNMVMDGITAKKACDFLGLSHATPLLWLEISDEDSVYSFCLKAIENMKAKELEEKVMEKALTDDDWRRDTVRMFVLKRFMPEYRDNSQTNGNTMVQFNVNVAGKNFEVQTDTKVIEIEGQENG